MNEDDEWEKQPQRVLVALGEVTRFTVEMLFTIDTNYNHVVKLAEVIVGSDYAGNTEYGLVTLPALVACVVRGDVDPRAEPRVLVGPGAGEGKEDAAVALVDAGRAYGLFAADMAFDLACSLASQHGAGLVTARECLCAAPPGWHLMQAVERGYAVLSWMDAPATVAPCRGKKSFDTCMRQEGWKGGNGRVCAQAALGANHMSLALGGLGADRYICDVQLTNASWEEVVRFSESGLRLPADWAVAGDGRAAATAAASAAAALASGALLPLGGDETTDGHKGYALLLLAHCLCALLAGKDRAPTAEPSPWADGASLGAAGPGAAMGAVEAERRRQLESLRWQQMGASPERHTYTFLALDPSRLPPGVAERTSALTYIVRHGQSAGSEETVLGPWDLEVDNMNRVSEMGGILYRAEVVDAADALARIRGVTPLRRIATCPLQSAVDFLGVP